MKEKPVTNLAPTEYSADIPNKREPFFGSGAAEWGMFIVGWMIVASARYVLGWLQTLLLLRDPRLRAPAPLPPAARLPLAVR